jgi:hypothetical protein
MSNLAERADILALNCPPNCTKRTPTCHANCRRYALYRASLDEAIKAERQSKVLDDNTTFRISHNNKWSF